MRLPWGQSGYEPVDPVPVMGTAPMEWLEQYDDFLVIDSDSSTGGREGEGDPAVASAPASIPELELEFDSPVAKRCMNFLTMGKLLYHEKGYRIDRPGYNNTESEFDFRMLWDCIQKNLVDKECLDWLVRWRNPASRAKPTYRNRTINKALQRFQLYAASNSLRVCKDDFCHSWLHRNVFWRTLGYNYRDCYVELRLISAEQTHGWDRLEGTWSGEFRVSPCMIHVRLNLSMQTARMALNSLRVMGLATKSGKSWRLYTPRKDEEVKLEQKAIVVKERRKLLRNEEGTKELSEIVSKKVVTS